MPAIAYSPTTCRAAQHFGDQGLVSADADADGRISRIPITRIAGGSRARALALHTQSTKRARRSAPPRPWLQKRSGAVNGVGLVVDARGLRATRQVGRDLGEDRVPVVGRGAADPDLHPAAAPAELLPDSTPVPGPLSVANGDSA
jgi:hypothetical protein